MRQNILQKVDWSVPATLDGTTAEQGQVSTNRAHVGTRVTPPWCIFSGIGYVFIRGACLGYRDRNIVSADCPRPLEVYTFAEKPWFDMPNALVHENILSGARMTPPPDCPDEIAALMRKCWLGQPHARPQAQEAFDIVSNISVTERFATATSESGYNILTSAGIQPKIEAAPAPEIPERPDAPSIAKHTTDAYPLRKIRKPWDRVARHTTEDYPLRNLVKPRDAMEQPLLPQ